MYQHEANSYYELVYKRVFVQLDVIDLLLSSTPIYAEDIKEVRNRMNYIAALLSKLLH